MVMNKENSFKPLEETETIHYCTHYTMTDSDMVDIPASRSYYNDSGERIDRYGHTSEDDFYEDCFERID